MKYRVGMAMVLLGALSGVSACVDSEVVSPEFEEGLFSVLGGLEVGEALSFEGAQAEEFILAGGADGAQYMFIPFLAAETGALQLRLEVSGNDLAEFGRSGGSRSRASIPDAAVHLRGTELHDQLREWERHAVTERLRDESAVRRRDAPSGASVNQQATPTPLVGQTLPLRVIDLAPSNPDLCANPLMRNGRVAAVTEHAILVEDVANPVYLNEAEIARIAAEYDELVHPVSVENFGEPTDIDGNGRVIIFMTSALNEVAAREGGGVTVGFTFALDLLPRRGSSEALSCDASNEGEIFYLIAPDPGGTLGVTVSKEAVFHFATGIIVHELQHLINFGRRLYLVPDAQELEEVWLNEALSHMAEELVFYRATGLNPGADIGWNTLTSSSALLEAYSRFARDNISFYAEYLSDPAAESPLGKSQSDDDFATRGAGWAFLRYLADQVEEEEAVLFQRLVNSPVAGVENLRHALGSDPMHYMHGWSVANFAEQLPSDRVERRFTQPSWDFTSIFANEMGGSPLTTRALQPEGSLSLSLRGGSASYVLLRAAPDRHARLNTRQASAPLGEFRATVMRVE